VSVPAFTPAEPVLIVMLCALAPAPAFAANVPPGAPKPAGAIRE